jgi:hypothetical protein
MEALHGAKLIEGPAILTTTFDEYTVVLTLTYPGKPFGFEPCGAIDLQSLLESEEGRQFSMLQCPGCLGT